MTGPSFCTCVILLCMCYGVLSAPESCFKGTETEIRKPILYNPNITVCRPDGLQYCFQYTHSDLKHRNIIEYGCASTSDHPCNKMIDPDYSCLDNVKLLGYENGRLCCSKITKYFRASSFSPVSSCYTGTSNSSGDFVEGGTPEKCDEKESLYCVAKMTVLGEDILEAKFFCDKTTSESECNNALAACSEQLDYKPGQNRSRVCCCGTSDCNVPEYMLKKHKPLQPSSFPGSPMLLYILLVVFGCIVLLGLIMMAGKQCGRSSNDSIDFDDRASFDRLDFDETENELEPSPPDKPLTKTASV